MILRQDGQFREFVGEAYIHEIMDGEAADCVPEDTDEDADENPITLTSIDSRRSGRSCSAYS